MQSIHHNAFISLQNATPLARAPTRTLQRVVAKMSTLCSDRIYAQITTLLFGIAFHDNFSSLASNYLYQYELCETRQFLLLFVASSHALSLLR
jgi:hypothetical protein